ncbi:MAG: cyclic nucleotide-binding domain-containing protein [Deltaproteobacteria bacterium]|nr:cyclic nucleotide-binding domain-containing protein [Deltaproteobacteria bacterium]
MIQEHRTIPEHPHISPGKRLLSFCPGQLIFKEGDFGISLYRIIRGCVKIYKEFETGTVVLAELGTGELFGEMAIMSGGIEPRSASAEAVDAVELEVWHCYTIRNESQAASPLIQFLANGLVKKLARINSIHYRLCVEANPPAVNQPEKKNEVLRLAVQSKAWQGDIVYHSLLFQAGQHIKGRGVEIDAGGLRFEIPVAAFERGGHEKGVKLDMVLTLAETKIQVYGVICNSARGDMSGYVSIRVDFWNLNHITKAVIAQFLQT